MSDRSSIEWTQATWNPTTGCDRTSPGCDHCYALTLAKRLRAMGNPKYQNDGSARTSGPGFGLTLHPDQLDLPRRWARPRVVFVNSMSDLFHKDIPLGFIRDVFAVMAETPRHTYQVLTKRSKRLAQIADKLEWSPNVWMGVSVETDSYAFRVDHLREVGAAVRFVSAEPLLGPVPSLNLSGIHWVIAGGESGKAARPMHPTWARRLRDRVPGRRGRLLLQAMGYVGSRSTGGEALRHRRGRAGAIGHARRRPRGARTCQTVIESRRRQAPRRTHVGPDAGESRTHSVARHRARTPAVARLERVEDQGAAGRLSACVHDCLQEGTPPNLH